MTIEQTVVRTLRRLPLERQREALDFIEHLEAASRSRQPRQSVRGLWADAGVDVSDEDIEDIRREMWREFPRQDIA